MTMTNDSAVLWNDHDDSAQAEADIKKHLEDTADNGDVSDVERALTLIKLARAQCHQSHFIEAMSSLNQALELSVKIESELDALESAPSSDDLDDYDVMCLFVNARKVRVAYLMQLGRLQHAQGNAEASVKQLRLAVQISRIEPRDEDLASNEIESMYLLALAESDVDEKVKRHQEAINIVERSEQKGIKSWSGDLENSLGWIYVDTERFDVGLECFEKAVKAREEELKAVVKTEKDAEKRKKKKVQCETKVRMAQWAVGYSLRSLGKLDEALEKQQAILAQLEDSTSGANAYAAIHQELALIYNAKAKAELAKRHALKAVEIIEAPDASHFTPAFFLGKNWDTAKVLEELKAIIA
ncbi:hypothetical protein HDV05_007308 [Chytridiales sp. JEL 0842]|nr:hypothetical protein HDV05_007308 [Chytridiales sp. JEL 0842]